MEGDDAMFSGDSATWVPLLVLPFGFALYVLVLLGVLWLATRVVRHAWYWQWSSEATVESADIPEPPSSDRA
jgi:hypothetical protein